MPTLLTKSQRQGTFQSASVLIPQDIMFIELTASLDAADVVDPTKRLGLVIERSTDDGLSWTPLLSAFWQGGGGGRSGPRAPMVSLSGSPGFPVLRAGDRVRGTLDMPTRFRAGLDVTWV